MSHCLRWLRMSLLVLASSFSFASVALAGASAPAPQQAFSADELDALLSPIALYSDGLLYQALMASTYPLEVVHADRFLKLNPGLHGDELDDALAKKN